MKKIRFVREDLDRFSSASHDRNPLHLSDEYAMRTPYGGRVVFGILDGLTALGLVADRPGWNLSRVEFEFFDIALLDVDYSVQMRESDPSAVTFQVMDGRRTVLDAVLGFRRANAMPPVQLGEAQPTLSEPVDLTGAQLTVGRRAAGKYAPSFPELERLCSHAHLNQSWLTRLQVAAMMWASYLIGMELPGKRALFSRLQIEFEDSRQAVAPFDYEAEIKEVNQFGEVTIQGTLASSGTVWARVSLAAHVREDLPQSTVSSVEKRVGRSPAMTGKVALVTGGSRGLGSCLVRALALHGCTVVLNFWRSQSLSERLRDSLAGTPGQVVLERGDISSLEWCQGAEKRLATQYGRLDFLICNASPPLLPLWLEASAAARVTDFVQASLAMVSSPMMAFLPLLAEKKGWHVMVSSVAAIQPHPHFPHYVVAKCAAEAMVRAAGTEYRGISSLIVRPARLLTDLTNTPLGRKGALPPESVAAAILKRLLSAPCPGRVELLDQFGN